jgi:DNA-binding LacI/PurR family transcriptional regulator
MKVTIKDVADRAGLSRGLVSSVLQGGSSNIGFTPETRQKILKAARELDYKLRQTNGIGVVHCVGEYRPEQIDWIQWISPMLARIQIEALNHDKLLSMFGYSSTELDTLLQGGRGPQIFRRKNIDGMLITGVAQPELISHISETGVPHILMNISDAHTHGLDSVCFDEVFTGAQATRYLLAKGHKKILHVSVGWPGRHYSVQGRRQGYEQAMAEAGLPGQVIEHVEDRRMGKPTPEFIMQMKKILSGPDRPTAIFAYNESVAACCHRILDDLGLRPTEAELIAAAWQEVRMLELLGIPCLELPGAEMGKIAFRMLLDKMQTHEPVPTVALRGMIREP